jgi:hypothetical protein
MFGPSIQASPFARGKARKSPRQRKPRQDREHSEAVALMQIVRAHESRWPALRWLHAIPNGGLRDKRTAARMKAEGQKPGVPDYSLPLRILHCPGLVLELKAAKPHGRRPSDEQLEWIAHYESQGWLCIVAYGADEAWAAIRQYLIEHHAVSP